MTQIGEPVHVAMLALPADTQSQPVACEWRCTLAQSGDHPEKHHHKRPPYPRGGTPDRKDGYSDAWKKAGRVPWQASPGINPRRWDDAYHLGRHSAASTYSHPEYATEGHHLISCDIFRESEYPALVFNALLMGYDINCAENGWHFPAHIVDIVCHNLQHHASQHTWSEPAPLKYDLDELVAPLLANLEQQCLNLCRGDVNGELHSQAAVIRNLHRLSDAIRRKLVRWDWYLTKVARMRLGDIRDFGIKKNKVKHAGDGFVIRYDKGASLKMVESRLALGGFPHFDHYVVAALEELDAGANPRVPFSWWLSRRMYRERLGRVAGPNSPDARTA